jgi:primosomal protein N' (replication factor Y)
MGGSALVLIPEIALIPQTTARFRRRFGDKVAVLHSRLTGAQRHTIWKRAKSGEVRVVIGPRSAVFVPLENLSVIVVDEEQDSSFKQEEKPHYNAVEVAKKRAQIEGCVLLLGSATPSLKSYSEAVEGKIGYLQLQSRPSKRDMPELELVDMRGRDGLISEELLEALEGCLKRGEQAIVLHNRRGHANYVQCRECGHIERCPNCSISLTYHSRDHKLRCHYCDFEIKPPEKCRECGEYAIRYAGAGTQRVEMELSNILPGARIARMDFDTTRGKGGHRQVLETFSEEKANVLLGTQMVAKGHHYPGVTVVGVLLADMGLAFPDYRAAERTFQLLYQAAGRTGRGKDRGRVIVQTYSPEHYVFKHLSRFDFAGFAGVELDFRKDLGYPPVGEIILLTLSSSSHSNAEKGADKVVKKLEKVCGEDAEILGPAPALIEKLRGKYRIHVIVRGKSLAESRKREIIAESAKALSSIRGTELQWDVDPLSIL